MPGLQNQNFQSSFYATTQNLTREVLQNLAWWPIKQNHEV